MARRTYSVAAYEQNQLLDFDGRVAIANLQRDLATEVREHYVVYHILMRLGVKYDAETMSVTWNARDGQVFIDSKKKGEDGNQSPTPKQVEAVGEKPKGNKKDRVSKTKETDQGTGNVQANTSNSGKSK